MSSSYHTFGPCMPSVKIGALASFATLSGYSALGVAMENGEIEEVFHKRDKKTDGAGDAPADVQVMGVECFINLRLSSWDQTVLDTLKALNGSAVGTLLATSGASFALYLPSSLDSPWVFPCCELLPSREPIGVQSNALTLRFRAWRYVGPTVSALAAGLPYSRTAPS